MLSPIHHPDDRPLQRFRQSETTPDPPAPERQDEVTRQLSGHWTHTALKRFMDEMDRIHVEDWMWPLIGGLLLLVGSVVVLRLLAAVHVLGGCCGGVFIVMVSGFMLLIGVRDRGDFSR